MSRVARSARDPRLEMPAECVVDLVGTMEESGVDVWLDGGWAVDAVLEIQARRHDDLDVIVELHVVEKLQAILGKRGYASRTAEHRRASR